MWLPIPIDSASIASAGGNEKNSGSWVDTELMSFCLVMEVLPSEGMCCCSCFLCALEKRKRKKSYVS